MKLSAVKQALEHLNEVVFVMPDGKRVPEHFHVTEVGLVTKHFIDCGGTVRNEKNISFQLWEANDTDHRLAPQKLSKIIHLSEQTLHLGDAEVEVEYQQGTIGRFGLSFNGNHFVLLNKETACLASDKCGIPPEKMKVSLADLGTNNQTACCTPGSGCC